MDFVQRAGRNEEIFRDLNEKIEEGELIEWCAQRLARFKVPRHVVVMDAADLPTSATGKVQKFLLVRRAQERLSL